MLLVAALKLWLGLGISVRGLHVLLLGAPGDLAVRQVTALGTSSASLATMAGAFHFGRRGRGRGRGCGRRRGSGSSLGRDNRPFAAVLALVTMGFVVGDTILNRALVPEDGSLALALCPLDPAAGEALARALTVAPHLSGRIKGNNRHENEAQKNEEGSGLNHIEGLMRAIPANVSGSVGWLMTL